MPSILARRGALCLPLVVLLLASVVLLTALPMPNVSAAGNTYYVAGNACASPTVTWLTGDTWILYGETYVGLGCTLTIQPGATVKADPGIHLNVNGTLLADGTPSAPILFEDNQTAVVPWAGIRFRPAAQGSVAWSNFTRVQIAVNVTSSSPAINNNTIVLASAGVYLDGSLSQVADNVIDGRRTGSFGIIATTSDASLSGNRINGTTIGIYAASGGNLTLSGNTITNISSAVAFGTAMAVYIDNVPSAVLAGNSIQTVVGRGGASGSGGDTAVGILVNGTATVTIEDNTIRDLRGGFGGNGAGSTIGAGSPGGPGGAAAGIALAFVTTAVLRDNTLTNITGGTGGVGGPSTVGSGGPGGVGGIAFAVELFSSTGNVSYLGNLVANVTGGVGGAGGAGSLTNNGEGGAGADVYGIFSAGGMNASISGNVVDSLLGGAGGNSLATSLPGAAGSGGNVTAAIVVVNGVATIHYNTINILTGGLGGSARSLGGSGGNATAALAVGSGMGFNDTFASYNRVSDLTGGAGGIGGKLSGNGGNASGLGGIHVNLSLRSNAVSVIQGGAGGVYGTPSNPASSGGFASAFLFLQVPSGVSSLDSAQDVSAGAAGTTITGPPAPPSYGVGFYFLGNTTDGTNATLTNGTISAVGDYDLYVDNYSAVTTLSTTFSSSKVAVMSAGNLTVQNFLGVRGYWPDNATLVPGLSILVRDDASTVFNASTPSGQRDWIVVTNREYIDSVTPVYHTTNVSVSFGGDAFWDNPRLVDMNASHTEDFGMIDSQAPWSAASVLPSYESADTFSVAYTYGDPSNGTGVKSVALWYRYEGGAWTVYPDQPALGTPFTFTASADGLYQFATIAVDNADIMQQPSPPTANDTWTIVDTVAPGSHVSSLPPYETSASFAVRWGPDAGVTDIQTYTIQYDTGAGWVVWLDNTTATSATFTSAGQGPVAFRSLAFDFARNAESKSGNDTWSIVDTVAPQVQAAGPAGDLTAAPSSVSVTFSEPMNESTVEDAFSIAPSVGGTFSWSNGSKTLTFRPSQAFALGTSYTVTIGTGATDLAGNSLGQVDVFTFVTPPAPGLSILDWWPLFVVLALALVAVAFFLVRRRGASAPAAVAEAPAAAPPPPPPKTEAAIDDVFLLYRKDGVLIKHETRRLRPDIDTDILSGMLTAVQQFVKDSFRGDEEEELNEMTVGQMHILIGRGKWLVLAATITGGDVASMTSQIERCVADMEDHNWDRLEEWDGDMEIAKALGPYLKRLIRGDYAS